MPESVPVRSVGTFEERIPKPGLRGSFSAVWVHQMVAGEPPPLVVMPDATVDLQWIDGQFRLAGPDLEPKTEVLRSDELVVGFRFQPAAASAWLGISLVDLVGQRVALNDLWGSRPLPLTDHICDETGIDEIVTALEGAVADLEPSRDVDGQMQQAFNLICQGAPADEPLIGWLTRLLGMSERTLRRRFNESFGYGPKTLDRILRYQRFLILGEDENLSTAIAAAEAGYSDQAHLIRESRRLSGRTPGDLQRLLSRADE